MKNTLFIFIVSLFLGACTRTPVDYFESKFYGKWTVKEVYEPISRKKKDFRSEFNDLTVEFKPDGDFTIAQNGLEANGYWRTKNLDFSISYKDSSGEKSKSESNLLLSLVTEKSSFMKINILAEVSFWKNEMTLRDVVKEKTIIYRFVR